MLQGQMMDRPLMISDIVTYAAEIRGDQEIVSARVEGDRHRYTYRDLAGRAAQLAHTLRKLGIGPGDRVATLAWNGYRHLELYYGISGIGAVCHTINPRLFAEQIVYVVGHAEDKVLFLDATFVPLVQGLRDKLPKGLRYVVLGEEVHGLEGALAYEDLLAEQPTEIDWPVFDERAASGICYTSGTTGHPKGVLYTHRSTLLHSYGLMTIATEVGLTPTDSILPVVPLFHVNAWGLPYAMPLTGTRIVMPGPKLDGASLFALMDEEKVTSAWGVPTVWLGLLGEMRKQGRRPDGFDVVIIGGSAAPAPMICEFEVDFGVRVVHGWGMTEMSPVGTLTTMGPTLNALPESEKRAFKTSQGRRLFGCELKIVDEAGNRLPHDGEAFGELLVRGHGVMSAYFGDDDTSARTFDDEGWMRTGDVAKIDEHGFLYIVDRTKDVIKSGGEWISSLDLEGAALGHPAIAECAVIAAAHPKWGERPLLVARLEQGRTATPDDIRAYLSDKVAKWWLPDDVVFVDDLPHTATGKLSKLTLRERFKDHVLPTAAE
ncbi:long-chain-fatty-acid--CoA ligase [Thalassobaculum sp. OXR-137]|uniref:long-chain-fatty-acid--CoA ligase n=1 Tax=Thalassobaculum sp. OXR-137 TaxID=3100173 RepID=UPI002AC93B3A|nr:long-chain-fatty-acid--CoA ligase [Thalassobaculum sp. OXR-137]WPZ32466.1 long-chain-fatty-acid--CoA ligase [Thalassobaculum sp. OXR-137]